MLEGLSKIISELSYLEMFFIFAGLVSVVLFFDALLFKWPGRFKNWYANRSRKSFDKQLKKYKKQIARQEDYQDEPLLLVIDLVDASGKFVIGLSMLLILEAVVTMFNIEILNANTDNMAKIAIVMMNLFILGIVGIGFGFYLVIQTTQFLNKKFFADVIMTFLDGAEKKGHLEDKYAAFVELMPKQYVDIITEEEWKKENEKAVKLLKGLQSHTAIKDESEKSVDKPK